MPEFSYRATILRGTWIGTTEAVWLCEPWPFWASKQQARFDHSQTSWLSQKQPCTLSQKKNWLASFGKQFVEMKGMQSQTMSDRGWVQTFRSSLCTIGRTTRVSHINWIAGSYPHDGGWTKQPCEFQNTRQLHLRPCKLHAHVSCALQLVSAFQLQHSTRPTFISFISPLNMWDVFVQLSVLVLVQVLLCSSKEKLYTTLCWLTILSWHRASKHC